jgi:hypothetical protein
MAAEGTAERRERSHDMTLKSFPQVGKKADCIDFPGMFMGMLFQIHPYQTPSFPPNIRLKFPSGSFSGNGHEGRLVNYGTVPM